MEVTRSLRNGGMNTRSLCDAIAHLDFNSACISIVAPNHSGFDPVDPSTFVEYDFYEV